MTPAASHKVVENMKNRKSNESTQNDFQHLTVKGTLYTLKKYHPETQIMVRVALRQAAFEIIGCRKSEMHRITSEWP